MSEELENKEHDENEISVQENPFAVDENVVKSKAEEELTFNLPPPKGKDEDVNHLVTIREGYRKSGTIAIRPYIDSKKENMGLEKNNMVVFPGTFQMEDMAAIEFRGKTKYINGLDEFSDSIRQLPNGEGKDAKIRQIRTIVAQLEREKAYNNIDVDDADFWSKVIMFRPDNKDVWGKMSRKCGNSPIFLDPVGKIEDLLTIIAIENGGFPGIAKSHEDARVSIKDKKWYLDKQTDTINTRTSSSKNKNKALGLLDELSEEHPRKLFYISKIIETNSLLYTFGTLPNQIYDNMDRYISGKGTEKEVKKAALTFLDYGNRPLGELKIRSAIKDCTFLKFIVTKGDQMIYKNDDNTLLGRNMSEVYEYLINPVNEDVLYAVVERAKQHWNK